MIKIEMGSTRSHSVENSFYKKLWTCHETDRLLKDDDDEVSPKAKGKGKVHHCTGTEALYRPYGP